MSSPAYKKIVVTLDGGGTETYSVAIADYSTISEGNILSFKIGRASCRERVYVLV